MPPRSNHPCPPWEQPRMPPLWTDRHLLKHNLRKLRLRTVINLASVISFVSVVKYCRIDYSQNFTMTDNMHCWRAVKRYVTPCYFRGARWSDMLELMIKWNGWRKNLDSISPLTTRKWISVKVSRRRHQRELTSTLMLWVEWRLFLNWKKSIKFNGLY